MGLIISKFRKQKSTIEVLEEIDKNIATHQKTKRQNQEYQKKFIASLILYSIIIYVVATIIFFICYFPETWKDWLFASIPLLLFPILIWLVKKIMHWYFVKRIASNDLKLQELRDKKKEILEDVMENETYKKAKEILEKYDPARFKKLEDEKPGPPTKSTDEEQVLPGRSPGPPIPRPIPPRERKNLDKFIDYLVGEGPQNRYALICRYCNSHNGMAMKEEFEYISFRCCYCYHLNPAKKQRPHAPRLDFPTPQSSPARKAIAAPDSKSKEEGESSEEEDDDASTSSKKSGDETIESEKTENEVGDEAAAEASDAEAADIPMADEDGTEEKAQDGVKEHDDEIVSEIKQEEPEVNQDITEEILAADNQPAAVEAEATTESKEHSKDD